MVYDETHAAAAFFDDSWGGIGLDYIVWDFAFVFVVIYAPYYGVCWDKLGGEVACGGVMVDEEPLGVFGAECAIFGEVGKGDEVVVV